MSRRKPFWKRTQWPGVYQHGQYQAHKLVTPWGAGSYCRWSLRLSLDGGFAGEGKEVFNDTTRTDLRRWIEQAIEDRVPRSGEP